MAPPRNRPIMEESRADIHNTKDRHQLAAQPSNSHTKSRRSGAPPTAAAGSSKEGVQPGVAATGTHNGGGDGDGAGGVGPLRMRAAVVGWY